MAKSRSKSPSAKPAKTAGGGVTADHALLGHIAWFSFISLSAIVHPGWLIGLYKIPLKDEMETPEWVVAQTVLQFWGIWIALGLGVFSAVKREGSANDKSLVCLANVIAGLLNLASTATKGVAQCKALGMPEDGVYLNVGISLVLIALSYLGWQSSGAAMPKLDLLTSAPGNASVDASRYTIVICAVFGLLMTFNLDGLLDAYHFGGGEGTLKKWVALAFTGVGITLLSSAVTMAFMLEASAKCSAALTRFQWAFFFAVFIQQACGIPSVELSNPKMYAEPNGLYFNVALWFIGYALHHRALVGSLPLIGALK